MGAGDKDINHAIPGEVKEDAAAGAPAPPGEPAAAPPAVAEARERICAELNAKYPRWLAWYHGGRWHARRRGGFRALAEPGTGRYAVSSPDLHEFRVLLKTENEAPVAGTAWDAQ